jgi:hypothetical protein
MASSAGPPRSTPAGSTTSIETGMSPVPPAAALRRPDRCGSAGQPDPGRRADEVYHLGAQSHVKVSFEIPEYTGESTGLGATRLLEVIRASGVKTRFYQAASSEMFGAAPPPQHELTRSIPQPLRLRQGLRLLDVRDLPGGRRPVRGQRPPCAPTPSPRSAATCGSGSMACPVGW